MAPWSGVPNRSTQAHIWQGVVGNTPCNDRMNIPSVLMFYQFNFEEQKIKYDKHATQNI